MYSLSDVFLLILIVKYIFANIIFQKMDLFVKDLLDDTKKHPYFVCRMLSINSKSFNVY